MTQLTTSNDTLPSSPDLRNVLTTGVRKTTLENGLTILLKAVHTAPVVSVQVWYRVGSRNEVPGLNGITHQLEHLMFKGTQSRPVQFGKLFSALGSASNAFTSYDMTAYYNTVGSDKLETLLILEADRMQNVLLTADQLASEKRVVISELQGYENSPDYRLSKGVMQQAFPHSNYGLPVGGTKADVEQFTLAQVQNYYQTYYQPSNATLVITGDFEPALVLEQIQTYFGPIPSTPVATEANPYTVTAPTSSAPLTLKEPGSAALFDAVYPLPDAQHPDIPALEILDSILSAGRNSRFYPALIESGLATHATAYVAALMDSGWYNISVTAAAPLPEVEQVVEATLEQLRSQPIAAEELERAKTQLKAGFILSNREIENQASQLAYNQIVTGDHCFSDRYLAGIEAVTPEDVLRVAQTYLTPTQRTLGFFEPTQFEGQPIGGIPATQTTEDFTPSEPVDPAQVARYLPDLPHVEGSDTQTLPERFQLDNGLTVLLLTDHSTPTVTLSGLLRAGNEWDYLTLAGVASLTADNLMSGTTRQDDLALAKALEDRGASLDFLSLREGVDISGYALSPDLPVMLETLADVLQQATFPQHLLDLSRQRMLTHLQLELDDPGSLARRMFQQKIYTQNHPFHGFPTANSLKNISREGILRFYQQHYCPANLILTLVGDFEVAAVRSQLEQTLGKWHNPESPAALNFPDPQLPNTIQRFQAPLPGKAQVVTYMGYPGIERHHPLYYAAMLLNQIIGGDTLSSRLGTEIRDRQGLTYGIYSYFAAGLHAGPFAIQMQTSPEDTQQAISSTIALLKQVKTEGITTSELQTAQRSILNSYPVDLADPDTLAQRLLMNEVLGLPIAEIRQLPQRIAAITMADIDQAIQSLIHPDRLVIVSAGPVE
ncbi:pitrilysin family protein [Acaryochloris sp. IP29b_bin.148]|uniref:M16 family metallopeptidase n=1 Tax=Acaryochloris sp. IP29b_bin.148 TaxID=2969218 RepID=UPI00262CB614|nr:pitrilysin family protein [Acaryochloris sp. IP29b_bin.148]